MIRLKRIIGDTKTTINAQLQQRDSNGDLTDTNLAGLTVKFKLVDSDGSIVIPESSASIVDAPTGLVAFSLTSAHATAIRAALPSGESSAEFYGYFLAYSGTDPDTFPVKQRNLEITFAESQ